ncbi:DUF1599 domain-containing protein [Compostibacter hankyongensis]|uniref:DUF1599 domain-containing protein n=1 Tax=Compostibacter hankyongensis TaxID=1007089 RepID=A0ABP8FNC2_9BACT
MQATNQQYDREIEKCRDIFLKKAADYGTSWRVLRPVSVVDQIFIKAQRIRTIQEQGVQRVAEQTDNEFRGILNYGIIGLIQLELQEDDPWEMPVEEVRRRYDEKVFVARSLMLDKNHDYGEAWRSMSQQSFTDLILMKLLRIRQILRNDGKTLISEGIDANFNDIVNYAAFALIKIGEG